MHRLKRLRTILERFCGIRRCVLGLWPQDRAEAVLAVPIRDVMVNPGRVDSHLSGNDTNLIISALH